jgi:hypothetical protein
MADSITETKPGLTSVKGLTSDGKVSSSPKAYTQEEVDGLIATRHSKLDSTIAGQGKTIAQLQAQLNANATAMKKWQEEQEAAEVESIKDNPDLMDIHKTRKQLREEKAQLEADRLTHAEELQQAQEVRKEIDCFEIASEYQCDASKLKDLCDIAKVSGRTDIERVASTMGTKKAPDQTNTVVIPTVDSGITTGAGDSLESLSPKERIEERNRRLLAGKK